MLSRRVMLGWLALALALAAQDGAAVPQIFFSKSFPGSKPDYFEITLDAAGKAAYRESPDDGDPLRFELTASETREIFALAEKLHFFQKPLETKAARMARMGLKTLRYRGAQNGEAQFNYSENPDVRALTDWFERIGETERYRSELERAAQFDRLGVNKALLLFETSLDHNRTVAPEQLLPILDKIATGPGYLHIAQARAAALAERIRSGKRTGK
jgi:hypothetical protein